MDDFESYRRLGAQGLIAAYRSGEMSPVDATEIALAAIDEFDTDLNAMIHVDPESARAAARSSAERWAVGRPAGPLDGVPTVVKDGLGMAGLPMYRGAAAMRRDPIIAAEDAPSVARLREDGAVILGKTSMCDFGMMASGYSSAFGPVRNPYDLSKTPGGSSSGTAAMIAAGVVPVGIGTDIVGSIRVPASFSGLAGLKPSYGRVPFAPNSSPAVVAGPMARNVADMGLLMNTITRPDRRDPASLPQVEIDYSGLQADWSGLRVGWLDHIGFGPTPNGEVLAAFAAARDVVAGTGARMVPLETGISQDEADGVEDFYRHRPLAELSMRKTADRVRSEVVDAWSARAERDSGQDHFRQFLLTQDLRARILAMMAEVDLLILPSVPVPAFNAEWPTLQGHDLHAPFCNTFLFNLTEQPAISLNCGMTAGGLPIGLQIVGPRFADALVVGCAAGLEPRLPQAGLPDL